MGGVWTIFNCNSTYSDKAQLGGSYKNNLSVTPLNSSGSTAESGDEITSWKYKGAGNNSNNASVKVWYVECETPYYFDDIYN